MAKYIFGSNIYGYEEHTTENFDKDVEKDDLLIIIVDKTVDDKIKDYYRIVDDALRKNARVVLIGIDDGNKIFNIIASNMVVFKCYDLYQVANKDAISAEYLIKLQERHPSIYEVQTFQDGDVVAYSDICNILYGIESLVEEGNIEGLKSHIERNIKSMDSLVSTINKMKSRYEEYNSDELNKAMDSLKAEIDKLNETIKEKDETLDKEKHNRDEYKVEAENLKREITKIRATALAPTAKTEIVSEPIIKRYSTFDTTLESNNKAIVLYFKEVSYVRYTNTLITMLANWMEYNNKVYKLLIYDIESNMVKNYGLDEVNGAYYTSNKDLVLRNKRKMVVTEPFQALVKDIITGDKAADVVIIYDRLKQFDNIVQGNNVFTFFIANSSKDIKNILSERKYNVIDTGRIITSTENSYTDPSGKAEFLDICKADLKDGERFSALTDSAKFKKYQKLITTRTKKSLMDEILATSHLKDRK